MTTPTIRLLTAQVALTTATIDRAITVQNFPIKNLVRYTDAITEVGNRNEVANYDQVTALLITANKRDHRIMIIIAINPLEAIPRIINFVERRILFIAPISSISGT